MAFLLGGQACMDSLQNDVQDLQWVISGIFSRTGPVNSFSWKFPDKQAADVDIEDLLDLYDCSEEEVDAEERQVSHIALYELLIDRLILLIHSMSKYVDTQISSENPQPREKLAEKGSIGVIVKQFWNQMLNMQTWISQTVSEKNSATSKLRNLQKNDGKVEESESQAEKVMEQASGTFEMIAATTEDMAVNGMLPPPGNINLSISKDSNNKACQTYETAFVPCESCDVVQRKMKEAGEIIIKVCMDQGLPSSLKKFKSQLTHVQWLTFNDICRWMSEQSKDIARVGKQNDLLQTTINPLKNEVKSCKRRTVEAEEKAKTIEKSMLVEKETQNSLRRQIETKMKEQNEKHSQVLQEEKQEKDALKNDKQKLESDIVEIKSHLDQQRKNLKQLEADYKTIQEDLEIKQKEAERSSHLSKEVADLRVQLSEVTTQLEENSRLLAKEQGKIRSANKHTESLQSKQDNLLSRMEALGQENEELSQQVNSLESEKVQFEDTIAELKVEAKDLRKKIIKNETEIKHLSGEKDVLEQAIKDTETSIQNLEKKLKEAKERERMIVEYPDLNGPVNTDLQGSGDIALDMSNQVKANCIRINILEEQNQGLEESIHKIKSMRGHTTNTEMPRNTESSMKPIPLWQQPAHEPSLNHRADSLGHRDNLKALGNRTSEDVGSSHPTHIKHQNWFHNNEELSVDALNPVTKPLGPQIKHSNLSQTSRPTSAKGQQGRPTSAKMQSVMAPVNTTSIGAYMQMKKSLSTTTYQDKALSKKGKPPKGRPASGRHTASAITMPSVNTQADGSIGGNVNTFSCPRCDKMYMRARDLEIHLSYCTV